ncbi:MAG TPA: cupin domain-containing protein [Candidatus Limnocylindrales bacterium]|nr:cupin domain-containing protein [Candidatus Limnocylindrales bacterium]
MAGRDERRPTDREGIVRSASEIERVELGPNAVAFALTGGDTDGRFSLTDFTMAGPPAPPPPPHVHDDADECVYLIEGSLHVGVGDDVRAVGPGSVVLVPRGTLHSLENPGPTAARFVVVLSPPGFEGFWQAMARLRAELDGPPDPETVLRLQHQFHMSTGGAARRFD